MLLNDTLLRVVKMLFVDPVGISRLFLASLGTQIDLVYPERVPQRSPMLVVSNHRSFMDAPVLMAALNQPIRFACHHYMSQVPGLREMVQVLGCLPLEASHQGQQTFFDQATRLLQTQVPVGIFPEGGQCMVQETSPFSVAAFQRGFAHLALRSSLPKLAVLPVTILSQAEQSHPGIPLPLLHFFDPSEPLFARMGWHPLVVYQKVRVIVGRPYWVTDAQKAQYRGKHARTLVNDLTQYCQSEIAQLLHREGCIHVNPGHRLQNNRISQKPNLLSHPQSAPS